MKFGGNFEHTLCFLGDGQIIWSSDPAFHQPSPGTIIRFATVFNFSALRVVSLNRKPEQDPFQHWSTTAVTEAGSTWQCTWGFDYDYNAGSANHLLWKTIYIFFLSIFDILNVFLSVINLLLEMGGLRIMMTLWSWTQWFLQMTRGQHTAHLCIWECCPLSHYEICFYEKKCHNLLWWMQGGGAVLLRMSSGTVRAWHWLFQFKTHKEEEILNIMCLPHFAGCAFWHKQW